MLDLEARKQRHVVAIAFDALHVVRHHHAHKRRGLISDVIGIDQDFADVRRKVVTDGPYDQTRLKIDQNRCLIGFGSPVNRTPQLQQVRQVPLKLLNRATDAGSAGNDAHALRRVELIHGLAQLLPFFALNPTRDTAAAGVVGHQYKVATGQRDKGGQCSALVAALFLLDLNNELLALF